MTCCPILPAASLTNTVTILWDFLFNVPKSNEYDPSGFKLNGTSSATSRFPLQHKKQIIYHLDYNLDHTPLKLRYSLYIYLLFDR